MKTIAYRTRDNTIMLEGVRNNYRLKLGEVFVESSLGSVGEIMECDSSNPYYQNAVPDIRDTLDMLDAEAKDMARRVRDAIRSVALFYRKGHKAGRVEMYLKKRVLSDLIGQSRKVKSRATA